MQKERVKKKKIGVKAILLLFSSLDFRLENWLKSERATGHKVARPVIFRRAATNFAGFPSVCWCGR